MVYQLSLFLCFNYLSHWKFFTSILSFEKSFFIFHLLMEIKEHHIISSLFVHKIFFPLMNNSFAPDEHANTEKNLGYKHCNQNYWKASEHRVFMNNLLLRSFSPHLYRFIRDTQRVSTSCWTILLPAFEHGCICLLC